MRNSKAGRARKWRRQRIKALENRLVSETNENTVETQAVDELVVVLQRVKVSSFLVGKKFDCVVPCWSCRRQVELGESAGIQSEIDEQSVTDDDHRAGPCIACSGRREVAEGRSVGVDVDDFVDLGERRVVRAHECDLIGRVDDD